MLRSARWLGWSLIFCTPWGALNAAAPPSDLAETVRPHRTTEGATGSLQGTVLARLTDDGIASATVFLFDLQGNLADTLTADGTGWFGVDNLAPGSYRLAAAADLYRDQVFGGDGCDDLLENCNILSGSVIEVAPGQAVDGLDPVLDQWGQITGVITDQVTRQALAGALVEAYDLQSETIVSTLSADDGTYVLGNLRPSEYAIRAQLDGYYGMAYPGLRCGSGCDPTTTGTPFFTSLNVVHDMTDLWLERIGGIGVVIRDARTGFLIPDPQIQIWDQNGDRVHPALQATDDSVFAGGLPEGTYFLNTDERRRGFVDEIYDDIVCRVACRPLEGTPVFLAEGEMVSIEFELAQGGTVMGSVNDLVFNEPFYAWVRLYDADRNLRAETRAAGFDGHYELFGLEPGTYYAVAENRVLFPNIPCPQLSCDLTTGTPLVVEGESIVEAVHFDLDLRQGLAGTVSDELTELPLNSVGVEVYDSSGALVVSAPTNSGGRYVFDLPTGTYFLKTDLSSSGYPGVDELYFDVACPAEGCNPLSGTPVDVGAFQARTDIDFAISDSGCLSSSRNLCLNDDRFRVSMTYRDFEGGSGFGRAIQLTEDSGTFYFFDSDNVEIIIKVLDACVAPFHHFWVFTTGLTNLSTTLSVTDTWAQTTRTYTNDLGNPFQLVRDTSAFATCDITMGAAPNLDRAGHQEQIHGLMDVIDVGAHNAASASSLEEQLANQPTQITPGSCDASSTTLCLQQERFRVEARWDTPDGQSGLGQAVPFTNDSGYFWFFVDDNVEVMIKILDGCVDPWNSFWVFAAGLTDVRVTLDVTDTLTGDTRQYVNGQGQAFVPIQDTAAFQTCF